MNKTAPPKRDGPAADRFQFSLLTMLVLVTGLSILCSLVTWRPSLGSLIAIPVVSIWWTFAALRAGRPRLAYYLVAPAMGVIICLLLSTPISPASAEILIDLVSRTSAPVSWQCIWSMCLSTLMTAAILRRPIRVSHPALAGIACIYLSALVFPLVLTPIYQIRGGLTRTTALGIDPSDFPLIMVVFGAVLSPVVATLSLHVAVPAGIAFCLILRRIDPREDVPIEGDAPVKTEHQPG